MLKRKVFRLVVLAGVVSVLAAGYIAFILTNEVVLPHKPSSVAIVYHDEELPSNLSVPIIIPLSALARNMEELQLVYSGTKRDKDHPDRKLDYAIRRSNFVLGIDTTLKQVNAATEVSCHFQLEDKETIIPGIRIDFPPIRTQPVRTTWSVGANAQGKLSASASPEIKNDWSIDPKLDLCGVLEYAEISGFKVTDYVQADFRDELKKEAWKLTKKIGDELQFKKRIEELWANLPSVVKVADKPMTWVSLVPQSVGINRLEYYSDRIETGLEVGISLRVNVGEKPDTVKVCLPHLEILDSRTSGFEIQLPIWSDYSAINTQLSKVILNKRVMLEKNAWAEITNIHVESYGGGVLFTVGFRAGHGWLNTFSFGLLNSVKGNLYLSAKPDLNVQAKSLKFAEIDFTEDSKSKILKIASWFSKDMILNELKKFSIDYKDDILEAKKTADLEIKTLIEKLPVNIRANVHVESLEPERLVCAQQVVGLLVRIKGKMSAYLH